MSADFTTMGIAELRDAWSEHDARPGSWRSRGGRCSKADYGTRVHWTWRTPEPARLLLSIRVQRRRGALVWHTAHEVPGHRLLEESTPQPLVSFAQLDALLDEMMRPDDPGHDLDVPSGLVVLTRPSLSDGEADALTRVFGGGL